MDPPASGRTRPPARPAGRRSEGRRLRARPSGPRRARRGDPGNARRALTPSTEPRCNTPIASIIAGHPHGEVGSYDYVYERHAPTGFAPRRIPANLFQLRTAPPRANHSGGGTPRDPGNRGEGPRRLASVRCLRGGRVGGARPRPPWHPPFPAPRAG